MASETNIGWCDKTFNYAEGCTKVDAGCTHCYAESQHNLWLAGLGEMTCWGPRAPRLQRAPAYWKLPAKWQREALRDGTQPRVFSSSLADVFEPQTPESRAYAGQTATIATNREKGLTRTVTFCDLDRERLRLLRAIHATPNLTWMLLTKRPEHILPALNAAWELALADYQEDDATPRWPANSKSGTTYREAKAFLHWLGEWTNQRPPYNVELGTSCSDQAAADLRIPILVNSGLARRYFVSLEPLLGRIDISPWVRQTLSTEDRNALYYQHGGGEDYTEAVERAEGRNLLTLVIGGGESGGKARPCHPLWAEGLQRQCARAGVSFFWKQWGEWLPLSQLTNEEMEALYRLKRPELVGFEGMSAETVAELYGKHCTVPVGYLTSGTLAAPKFYLDKAQDGTGMTEAYSTPGLTMMMFRVGVERASNRLNGRYYEELPDGIRPPQLVEPLNP